jgi:hypothetical protein
MSKWSRLKVAMLTVAAASSGVLLHSCISLDALYPRILQWVAIGSIFD